MPEELLKPSVTLGGEEGIGDEEMERLLRDALSGILPRLRRVLILPPDHTRYHSDAGRITCDLYRILKDHCRVDVMPALGTHVPVSREEAEEMYPLIPWEELIVHSWRDDVIRIAEVPGEFVASVSEGLVTDPITVEINRRLLDPSYDLIISVGQVVPHEVVGMANRNKNLFVGCGGASMINGSHMLGAFYGLERIMGRDHTPVRDVFDYAEEHFLGDLPLSYILTVTTAPEGRIRDHAVCIGRDRRYFEEAVRLAQRYNLTKLDRPIRKCVVRLDPEEFKSTWLGNKAIYRTRMAIADGGELIILADGVDRFGEDPVIDRLIRKYGYCGREQTIRNVRENAELKENLSAAAHMIHSSSDGRFVITYCTEKLTREEVEGVGYGYRPFREAREVYDPDRMIPGWNDVGGEEIYYIPNPALGLWTR